METPVWIVTTGDVTRSYDEFVSFFCFFYESTNIFWTVLQVGIHLENVVGVEIFEDVYEAAGVSVAKPFLLSTYKVKVGMFFLKLFDDGSSAVGGVVVNNENAEVPVLYRFEF